MRYVAVAPAESLAVTMVNVRSGDRSVTVVMLPGPIGSAYAMRHVVALLTARGISSVVVDPLGMGGSSKPASADYTLSTQARRVGAVLDSLRLGHVVLVGHGTSATIAFHLSADAPDRVVGVVSLAGGPIDAQRTGAVSLALALGPLLDNPLGRALARRKFMAGAREQSAGGAWCTREVARAYLAFFERDTHASLQALRAMSMAREASPIANRLSSIVAPVHLLLGESPSASMPTAMQIALLSRNITRLRVDTIANAGTMLHEERADAVANAVQTMVTRANAVASCPDRGNCQ